MDQLPNFVKLLADFGALGVVVFIWYQDQKQTQKILNNYRKDMDELREMYKSNVSLVKDYQSIAGDLKDIVILSTQQITRLDQDIQRNQYCPFLRVDSHKYRIEVTKNEQ